MGVVVSMRDGLVADAFLNEVNRHYQSAFNSYSSRKEKGNVDGFVEERMMECLKNMNVWSVIAEQAIVKRDDTLLIESLANLNKWEYALILLFHLAKSNL